MFSAGFSLLIGIKCSHLGLISSTYPRINICKCCKFFLVVAAVKISPGEQNNSRAILSQANKIFTHSPKTCFLNGPTLLSNNGVCPLLILQSCIVAMQRCLYCTSSFSLRSHLFPGFCNAGKCTTPSACSTSSASSGRRTINTF